jgi:alkanesulfonate monooxygenase SsuD/methylene tetrahydromethanopterin reductase-like flavin-dependent oxidoreductase (luciferase family)
MRSGLALPTGGPCADPRLLVELAERAEASGWDGVFLEDYVVFQGDPHAPTCDSWTALAAIAMRTNGLILGTAVTPLARRRPWVVARQAAAVDQLSGGRVVLGAGLGDVGDHVARDASFTHFREELDAHRRARMLDEALEIVVGLWSGEPFSFRGEHFAVDEVTFAPRPVQKPRIPVWIGGGYPNPGPSKRAARWDGSMLYGARERGREHDLTPDDVRAIRAAAGDRDGYDVMVGGRARSDDWGAERERLRELAEAGTTWSCEYVPVADIDDMRKAVDRGPLTPA